MVMPVFSMHTCQWRVAAGPCLAKRLGIYRAEKEPQCGRVFSGLDLRLYVWLVLLSSELPETRYFNRVAFPATSTKSERADRIKITIRFTREERGYI